MKHAFVLQKRTVSTFNRKSAGNRWCQPVPLFLSFDAGCEINCSTILLPVKCYPRFTFAIRAQRWSIIFLFLATNSTKYCLFRRRRRILSRRSSRWLRFSFSAFAIFLYRSVSNSTLAIANRRVPWSPSSPSSLRPCPASSTRIPSPAQGRHVSHKAAATLRRADTNTCQQRRPTRVAEWVENSLEILSGPWTTRKANPEKSSALPVPTAIHTTTPK